MMMSTEPSPYMLTLNQQIADVETGVLYSQHLSMTLGILLDPFC